MLFSKLCIFRHLKLVLEQVRQNGLVLHFKAPQAHALSRSAISRVAGSFELVLEKLGRLVSCCFKTSQAHACGD